MSSKPSRIYVITPVILFSFLLAGCGLSAEELAATSAVQTAAAATDTPVPTQHPPPTGMPAQLPEPTSTPMVITNFGSIVGKWIKIQPSWTRKGPDVEWRFNINEDGTASNWAEGGGTTRVSLRLEDGLLYHNYFVEWGCKDMTLTGTYEVSGVPGEYINFTVVDDICATSRHLRGKWTAASAP